MFFFRTIPTITIKKRDIVSYHDLEQLQRATVLITNYHQLELRQNSRYQIGSVVSGRPHQRGGRKGNAEYDD